MISNKKAILQWQCVAGFVCLVSINQTAGAQSAVTIYGALNPGVSIFNNVAGGRTTVMSDGVIQASRIGFRGQEDLGGGLSTVFQLESGINVKNGALGQGGLLFGRQAYVGLRSTNLGSITLGRQYSFLYDNFVLMTNGVTTYNLYAFKMGDADGTAGQRFNNSVKYVSPNLNGFQIGAMHGVGEVPGSSNSQSNDSLGVTYTASRFKLAAAYAVQRDIRPALPIGANVFGQRVNQITFDKIATAAVGGQFTIDKTDLHAIASTVNYKVAGQSATLKMLDLGVARPISSVLTGAFGYNYYRVEGARFNQFSVGLDYLLSKRTDLAISYATVKGSEGTSPQLFAAPGPSTSRTQQVATVGIRHRF